MGQESCALYPILSSFANLNLGDFLAWAAILFILLAGIWMPLFRSKEQKKCQKETAPTVAPTSAIAPVAAIPFADRLRQGLSRSRQEVWGRALSLFKAGVNDDVLQELEEVLYAADIGPSMVSELMTAISRAHLVKPMNSEDDVKQFLFSFLKEKMLSAQAKLSPELWHFDAAQANSLKTIMIVGVNGAGKTTTIGKLATKLRRQGAKVIVGACDTFRAAAVDQLQVWCDRAEVQMVRAKEGNNPTGVAYDALQLAMQQQADYCLLDTAGRLHTKENLMEELAKTKRVLSKLDADAPQQVLLVLDAITGQNALRQAEEFHKFLGLTGLIFTKCDGSSKAGSAVKIAHELQVPITYIGVGESVEDLDIFDLDQYLRALLNIETTET